jgi:hypothetical protein
MTGTFIVGGVFGKEAKGGWSYNNDGCEGGGQWHANTPY